MLYRYIWFVSSFFNLTKKFFFRVEKRHVGFYILVNMSKLKPQSHETIATFINYIIVCNNNVGSNGSETRLI